MCSPTVVSIKPLQRKKSKTFARNAANISLLAIWLNTNWQYMKDSNFLAVFANMKQLQRAVLLNIAGQCMKKSNTLVGNVINISLLRDICINTNLAAIGLICKVFVFLWKPKMFIIGIYAWWTHNEPKDIYTFYVFFSP